MTIEPGVAHYRPPEDVVTTATEVTRLQPRTYHVEATQHQSAAAQQSKTMMEANVTKLPLSRATITPLYIIPDHSLASDWSLVSTSPGSTFMYEPDASDQNKALLSPCTTDALPSPIPGQMCAPAAPRRSDDLCGLTEESITLTNCDVSLWGQVEGPPIQEYLNDFGPGESSIKAIGDELAALTTQTRIKQEPGVCCESADDCDVLTQGKVPDSQVGLKDRMDNGPTLAQLNDGESVLDMFMPIGNPTSQSRSWSGEESTKSSIVPGLSSTSLTHTNSITTMSGITPSWEESYGLSSSSSGSTLASSASSVRVKSETLTRPALASCGLVAASVSNQSASLLQGVQPPQFGKQRSQTAQYPAGAVAYRLPATSTSTSRTVSSLPAGFQPDLTNRQPPSKSLQELLSGPSTVTAATVGSTAPKVPSSESPRAKKRGLSPDGSSNGSGGSMERKWEEIRSYIDSNINCKEEEERRRAKISAAATGNKRVKRESESSACTSFQGDHQDFDDDALSIKQEIDSDFENSDEDLSDVESNASYSSFAEEILHGDKKEKRYFWQYNTQSKGPKGKRLCKSMQERDPHSLADFEDPVFQPDLNDVRYKHNGKARKGDGNDITPSPWKLFQIGNELQKLTRKINSIAETEKPVRKDGVKSKSRKEKNKYASRACRLKKKAQHEANKVKLHGLENEHHQLMEVLKVVKQNIYYRIKDNVIKPDKESFTSMLEKEINDKLSSMIAGNTSDFVNTVLQKVAEGDKKGGITYHRN